MARDVWPWVRRGVTVAILGGLIWRVGTGPFVDGLRRIDVPTVIAAAGLNLVATVACGWRWATIAARLGVGVSLRSAVGAYYRSQFLNTVLPGGVLGDVHRGVAHGRASGDVGRGLRTVAWDRASGQVVQVALAAVVLLVLPSPVRAAMPAVAGGLLAVLLVLLVLARTAPRRGPAWWRNGVRAARSDLREAVLARAAWPSIAVASVVMVACHAATFLIAARAAGVAVGPGTMLPLALLVLLAMGLPVNVGGWGPREGVAAWAFAAAGLGAAAGVVTAVVYGVLAFAAALPGAAVLVTRRAESGQSDSVDSRQLLAVGAGDGARG